MTEKVSTLITELTNMGYVFYLDGKGLRYRYTGLTEPPEDKVVPLLNTIKANREAVIGHLKSETPIPFNVLFDMFLDAVRGIEKVYSPMVWNTGIMETPEYQQVWDKLNDVCLKCIRGRAGLVDYQNTLVEWERTVKNVSKDKLKTHVL